MTQRNGTPAELKPEMVTAIIDTREQLPVDLDPLQSVVRTLDLADYSWVGGEHICRIERKSLGDLLACVGRERGAVRPRVRTATWIRNAGHRCRVNVAGTGSRTVAQSDHAKNRPSAVVSAG